MIVRIVRIVLRCIVFRDDGIRRQIQNQPTVSGAEGCLQFLIQAHVFHHLIDHHVSSCFECTATAGIFTLLRRFHLREVLPKVLVRAHHARIFIRQLADRRSLHRGVLAFRIIHTLVLIVHVLRVSLLTKSDFSLLIRHIHKIIKIHGLLLNLIVAFTTKIIISKNPHHRKQKCGFFKEFQGFLSVRLCAIFL